MSKEVLVVSEWVPYVTSLVCAGLAFALGGKWAKGKKTLTSAASLIKEIEEAVEDNRVTQVEIERIFAKWRTLVGNLREMKG